LDKYSSPKSQIAPPRGLKKRTVIGGLMILILVVLAIWLPIDEAPTETTLRWRAEVDALGEPDLQPYYYLVGYLAPKGTDPYTYGRDLAEKHKGQASYQVKPINKADELSVPESHVSLTCELKDPKCQNTFLDNIEHWKTVLDEHEEYLHRYDTVISHGHFTEIQSFSGARPKSIALLHAARISRLRALIMAQEGQARFAVAKVIDELRKVRSQQAYSNTQLHTLALSSVSNTLLNTLTDLLLVYKQRPRAPLESIDAFDDNYRLILVHEYQFLTKQALPRFTLRDQNPNKDKLNSWLESVLMQPVRTENKISAAFEKSLLNVQEKRDLEEFYSERPSFWQQPRNSKGELFLSIFLSTPMDKLRKHQEDFNQKLVVYLELLKNSQP